MILKIKDERYVSSLDNIENPLVDELDEMEYF